MSDPQASHPQPQPAAGADDQVPSSTPGPVEGARPPEQAGWGLGGAVFSLVVGGLTLLLVLLVVAQELPLGIPGEWVWRYNAGFAADLFAEMRLPLGLLLILLLLVRYLSRSRRALAGWAREAWAVGLIVVAGLLVQLAAGAMYAGLGQDVLAVGTESVGGYFGLSEEIVSPRAFLAGYPRLLATREPVGHLNTHPPGNTMYFYALRRLFEKFPGLARRVNALETHSMRGPDGAFAWLEAQHQVVFSYAERAAIYAGAFLNRLVAVLVAVPLYLLARFSMGKRQAVWVAALGVTVPAVLVFLPGFDAAYPTAAATVTVLLVGALVWRSLTLAFFSGLALYGAMVFTPAVAVVVFMVLLWYAAARWTEWGRRLRRQPGQASLAGLVGTGFLGFGVPLVLAWVLLSFDALSTWWQVMASNARFNRLTGRSYLPWVLYNPVDFLMFLGVALSGLLVVGVAGLLGRLRAWRHWDPLTVGLGAYVVVLLLLDLSGANAGETARLWMFLMPGAALLVAPTLERFGSGSGWVLLVVLLSQAVQAFVFKLGLNVLFII